jgi:hypothetical protein
MSGIRGSCVQYHFSTLMLFHAEIVSQIYTYTYKKTLKSVLYHTFFRLFLILKMQELRSGFGLTGARSFHSTVEYECIP